MTDKECPNCCSDYREDGGCLCPPPRAGAAVPAKPPVKPRSAELLLYWEWMRSLPDSEAKLGALIQFTHQLVIELTNIETAFANNLKETVK